MKKYLGLMILCFMVLVSKVSAQETAKQDTVQAYQLYQAQNYPDAERLLLSAIQIDPNYEPAHQVLGGVYMAENRKPEAMAQYQQALTLQPNNPALSAYVQSLQPQEPVASLATPVAAAPAAPAETQTITESLAKPAKDTKENLDKAHFIVGAFGGLAVGSTGFTSTPYLTYGLGGGGGIYVGASFDRHFSVELKLADYSMPYTYPSAVYYGYTYPAVTYALEEFEMITSCKYIIGSKGVRPYITMGMGCDFAYDSGSGYASTAPLFEGGVGITIPLGHQWNVFAEIDYDLILNVQYSVDQTISYIPMNIGVQFNTH